MSNINAVQVQQTNDASTVSKCSAVSKNYFSDNFIHEFVDKKKLRASLIHLGYYTRAVIMNKLIIKYIQFLNNQRISKFQIISCGSGFDTTYWRLSQDNLLDGLVYIEIDFPNVIQKKISIIQQSEKLQSALQPLEQFKNGIYKLNYNFYLLEADLSDTERLEKLLGGIPVDYNIPTLFLSECVITYMQEFDSRKLIKWMSDNFTNCGFLNYEQIHPNDGFGRVMLKHFEKLQSCLYSVTEYPDCESHFLRYKTLGFESSSAVSEWDAFIHLTSRNEKKRVFGLELFDEFEEFHQKCVHYVISYAGNGVSSRYVHSISIGTSPTVPNQMEIKANSLNCDLEIYKHSSCKGNGESFVFGGCNRQKRSSSLYKITYKDQLTIKEIQYSGSSNTRLDIVYASVVYFELNNSRFVCLYGGRTSPDKIPNGDSPIVFQCSEDKFDVRTLVSVGNSNNPTPRYRTAMVAVNASEFEVHCWVFGGRTERIDNILSDLWRLTINYQNDNLTYEWVEYKKKSKDWPCGRMSHSLTFHPKNHGLFIIGGLAEDSTSVLNDIWKWSYQSESWEEIRLNGELLPRYGHTAHLKDDFIYLIGGVNTLPGRQPGLAVIDLVNQTVVEYNILVDTPTPFLTFNHTSELINCGEDSCIYILGGGGNCFSFGTYLNPCVLCIRLSCLP